MAQQRMKSFLVPDTSVIGIDTGGKTVGIAFMDWAGDKLIGMTFLQCDFVSAQFVLEAVLVKYYADQEQYRYRYAGIEKFVTGQAAGTKGRNADITRQLVVQFAEQLQMWGYHTVTRPAAEVKHWATDKRLETLGVKERIPVNGDMNHAADAGRQALFVSRWDAHKPDPLR